MPARISVKDRDLRYMLVNKAQAESIGVTPQQAIGKRYSDYYNRKYSEDAWRRYIDDVIERDRRALAGESILFHEETVAQRDGEWAPIEWLRLLAEMQARDGVDPLALSEALEDVREQYLGLRRLIERRAETEERLMLPQQEAAVRRAA